MYRLGSFSIKEGVNLLIWTLSLFKFHDRVPEKAEGDFSGDRKVG